VTAAEIAAIRLELSRCRAQSDNALGTAMSMLDKLERWLREQRKQSKEATT
jgi:hypothetical protein